MAAEARKSPSPTPPKDAKRADAQPDSSDDDNTVVVSITPVRVLSGLALMAVFLLAGYLFSRARGAGPMAAIPTLVPGTTCNIGMPSHPLVGQKPIEISGKLLDGKPAKVSDFMGKPLMINFWATWCPPCRMEMPWMEAAYQKYKDYGFNILAVDAGERVEPGTENEVVGNFTREIGLNFPVMLAADTFVAQGQYSVYALPSSFMVSREGLVVNTVRGAFPNQQMLEACIDPILRASSGS